MAKNTALAKNVDVASSSAGDSAGDNGAVVKATAVLPPDVLNKKIHDHLLPDYIARVLDEKQGHVRAFTKACVFVEKNGSPIFWTYAAGMVVGMVGFITAGLSIAPLTLVGYGVYGVMKFSSNKYTALVEKAEEKLAADMQTGAAQQLYAETFLQQQIEGMKAVIALHPMSDKPLETLASLRAEFDQVQQRTAQLQGSDKAPVKTQFLKL